MKALSVRGDYVMDMIAGKKKIEYRTWYTKYRGDLLMCSTAKKVAGAVPGYALCVVHLDSVEYCEEDDFYHWNISNVRVIKPIHVKGQLKLFNVPNKLIKPIGEEQFKEEIKPLIYQPKFRRKKRNQRFFILPMYKTKKYGVVSCRMENKILADLERDFERKKREESEPTGRDKNSKHDNRQRASLIFYG